MTAKPTQSHPPSCGDGRMIAMQVTCYPFFRPDGNAAYNLPLRGWPVCRPVRRLSAQFPADGRGFDRFRVGRGAAGRMDVASDICPLPRLHESL
jgi:hypothetical protein